MRTVIISKTERKGRGKDVPQGEKTEHERSREDGGRATPINAFLMSVEPFQLDRGLSNKRSRKETMFDARWTLRRA